MKPLPLLGLISLPVLTLAAACAKPPETDIAAVRARLSGMGPAEVTACMGPPAMRQTRGNITLFTYPSPTAAQGPIATPGDATMMTFRYAPFSGDPVPSGLGEGEGPIAPAGCLVNVVLDSGKVRAVTYVGPQGRLLKQAPECTEVVKRCVPPDSGAPR